MAETLKERANSYAAKAEELSHAADGTELPWWTGLAGLLRAQDAALDAKDAEIESRDTTIIGLEEKIAALAPHGTCACAWDAPGDICMHHSPQLAAAKAEIERLKEALRPFADFAPYVEMFVEGRSQFGGSSVLPTKHFRQSDFARARAALGGK